MIYLVIIVVAAAGGIFRLWMAQRRQRVSVESIQGFQSSLERISSYGAVRPPPRTGAGARDRDSRPRRPYGRPVALDPARREAAKRRLEARRRAARARAS